MQSVVLAAGIAIGGLGIASGAQALEITSWTNITGNGTNVASQLKVDVTAVGGSQVKFRFTNTAVISSSITDIYFDDKGVSVLADLESLTDSGAGVAFSESANPGNLPGGNAPSINFDSDFDADSDSGAGGVAANGINSGSEWLDILFDLSNGKTFADVLAELANGELVIGMHILSLPGGKSDSYISTSTPPTTSVPEPATLGLFGAGLLGLGLLRRRRVI